MRYLLQIVEASIFKYCDIEYCAVEPPLLSRVRREIGVETPY